MAITNYNLLANYTSTTMAVSTAPLCLLLLPLLLLLLGAVCLANAVTTPVLPDLVDTAKFLYDTLSQAQTQQEGQLTLGGPTTLGEPTKFEPIIHYCYYNSHGLLIC